MRRYWIENSFNEDNQLIIDGESFHHIFGVCRQTVGSHFEVLGHNDLAILVKVLEVKKKSALVEKVEARKIPPLPRPLLNLVLAVPRFPVLESCIERMVELGVHSVHLVYSEFSFIRTESSLPAQKMDRWNKIVLSATQQTGRSELMKIHAPLKLKDFIEINRNQIQNGLFAYEGNKEVCPSRQLRHEIQRLQQLWALPQQGSGPPENFWLFIGSEGGFSHAEVELFAKEGLNPVTLGEQVLRVETACLALVSILKYELEPKK